MPKEQSADMQKQIDEIDLKLYNLLIHRTELVERQPVIAAIFRVMSLPKSGAKY